MASSPKRRKNGHDTDPRSDQITAHVENPNSRRVQCELGRFLEWCGDSGLDVNRKVTCWQSCFQVQQHHPAACQCLSQVRQGKEGSCSRYGMVAVDDIAEGETLFTIPRGILLQPSSCSIGSLLQEGERELHSDSGWVPLLLGLMFEYTKADSKWRPYLDICPDYSQLDSPMFWDRKMVTIELQGTGVPVLVHRDTENVHREYHTIAVPFMKKNPEHFDLGIHTLELYRRLVAFVMAYSFTVPTERAQGPRGNAGDEEDSDDDDDDDDDDDEEEEEGRGGAAATMMVPMADILNHVAKNNARLQFGQTSLTMVATRDIKKDEEVYNTYGELPNWQLLQMYGFTEPYPENIYDTVDLPLALLKDQLDRGSVAEAAFVQSKWDFLMESEDGLDDSIVVGCEGILNKWETYQALKILSMTPAEFEEYQVGLADDDVIEDEDNDIEYNLEELFSFDGLSELPARWRKLVSGCASEHLKSYKNTTEQDVELLRKHESGSPTLTSRERYACHLRIGQGKLLERLVQSVRTAGRVEVL